MNRHRLGMWVVTASALLLGCPPIQTGIVTARVVVREAGTINLVPVPGASCAIDGGVMRVTDANGELRFTGSAPGPHTIGCTKTADTGELLGVLREIDLPREAGHGGFVNLGDIELLPIQAPAPVQAVEGVRAATVSWTAPASSGGAPVLSYVVVANPGGATVEVDGAATAATVTGLADDTTYTFTVFARTALGDGPAGTSNAITTPKVPAAPLRVRATPAVESALIEWWAPADSGRSPLTGFTITVTPGGTSLTVGPDARSVLFGGLTPGGSYRFTVAAENAVGVGAASVETIAVAPLSPAVVSGVVTADGAGGCIAVDYRLDQAQGLPADVVIEVDATGTGVFQRVTQAGTATGDGVSGLRAGQHRFLWNSTRDLPARTTTAQLRISAQVGGVAGGAPQLRTLTVANGLAYAPATKLTSSGGPLDVVLADFNRDGRLDLAAIDRAGNGVTLQIGVGDGTFKAGAKAAAGLSPSALVAADLNRDGIADLAVASTGADAVSVLIGNGDGTFAAPVGYAAGVAPVALTVGDLDGDGAPDLAAVGADLAVLLNLGGGTFGAATRFAAGTSPTSVAAGDLDRDGALELVVASDGIAWTLHGRGDGSFDAAVSHAAGAGARSIGVGDLDGDGALDVVTGGGSELSVLRGSGSGALLPAISLPAGATVARVALADLDGDGALDLVATAGDARVWLGASGSPVTFATGTSPEALAIGDLNRDGKLDLVSADATANTVAVQLSTEPARCDVGLTGRPSVTLPTAATHLVTGDLNGDGRPDAVAASSTELSVALGAGNGSLRPPLAAVGIAGQLSDLAVADLDRDGTLDLVNTNRIARAVEVRLGVGDGTFQPAVSYTVTSAPEAIAIGDLDRDGALDLIVAGGAQVNVLLGLAGGAFAAAVPYDCGSSTEALRAIAVGDLDADGTLDVVAAGDGLAVFAGVGDGTLGVAVRTALPAPSGARVAVGDLDGDGKLDVAAAGALLLGSGDGSFLVGAPVSAPVAAGDLDGDGRLELVTATDVLRAVGDGTFSVAAGLGVTAAAASIADLDGDGRLDVVLAEGARLQVARGVGGAAVAQAGPSLATANAQSATVGDFDADGSLDLVLVDADATIRLGIGDGTFGAPAALTTGTGPTAAASGDLDGDGRLDLAIASGAEVTVSLGNGDGTFRALSPVAVGADPRVLVTADLDRDGVLDLLTVSRTGGTISVLLGRGDGTFSALTDTAACSGPAGGVVADLNRDGHLDAAVACASGASVVAVLLGNGDGTFQAPTSFATGAGPSALTVGDFDRDGALDLATADAAGRTLSVLHGNGDGTFAAPSSRAIPVVVAALQTADLDGDGALDLVASSPGTQQLLIAFGRGDGSFTPARPWWSPNASAALAIADLNSDGISDVAGSTAVLAQ